MAPADVHGTLGGVYGCLRSLRGANGWKKTSLRLRNGDLDGFRRIFVDSDGVRRNLAGFAEPLAHTDACPTSVRGILIFKQSCRLTICELCCIPTSCPIYCLALPLPVSPPPQKSTSQICKLLPVVTSNVKTNKGIKYKNLGFPKAGFSCS